MVARDTTIAVVEEDELAPLVAYAGRRGWSVAWDRDALGVLVEGPHPAPGVAARVRLHADVTNYRALPPTWTFRPPADADAEKRQAAPPPKSLFPKGVSVPNVGSSIFHSQRVICAPFNLLAYKSHDGPHADWEATNWLAVRGHVHATTLAAMFAQIFQHLAHCPEWL